MLPKNPPSRMTDREHVGCHCEPSRCEEPPKFGDATELTGGSPWPKETRQVEEE